MKIATASLNQTPLDWTRNTDNIRTALDWARKRDTQILCLPELCISSVGCGRLFQRRSIVERSMDILLELLPELKGMIVTLGLPLEYEGHLFNAAALVVDGRILGFQCKTTVSPHNLQELNWFRPWTKNYHAVLERNDQAYKIGDLAFEFNLSVDVGKSGSNDATSVFHVAVEVGEPDWSVPRAPLAGDRKKVDLLLNPGASRFSLGKQAARLRWAVESTREHDYIHVFSNYVGNESGPLIYDGGSFIVQKGNLLAETPRFSYHDVQAAVAELGSGATVESEPLGKEEEFSRAVPLGMLDYLRKSGAGGFALSLSGGADSTSLAVLASLGVRAALAELGHEGFARQFGFLPGIEPSMGPEAILERLLVCFYQSTKNSSETTRRAARTVAENLGAEYHELDIDPLVDAYVKLASKALGRELTWQTDDIALQNIQARTRGPAAWLIANARNALLLTTGNRSEATLGYTTMDGDTCGCLAPIGGIDKAFLRHWLRWLETTGPKIDGQSVALPFLSIVNAQPPTAELRPRGTGENQTDEKDMMPYEVLNRIEQLGPTENKSVSEILDVLREEFPTFTEEERTVWVDRFFRLRRRNQWKRWRYALSFHLDDSTLPAEAWLQFPALVYGH